MCKCSGGGGFEDISWGDNRLGGKSATSVKSNWSSGGLSGRGGGTMGEVRPEDGADIVVTDSVVGDIELIDFLLSLFRHNFLKLLTDIKVALLEVLTMLASSSPVTESEENLLVVGRL